MNPKIGDLRKKAMALPLLPGVYIMHAQNNEIIYIGKMTKDEEEKWKILKT